MSVSSSYLAKSSPEQISTLPFPPEIFCEIAKNLSPEDVANFSQTSKASQHYMDTDNTWKAFVERDFPDQFARIKKTENITWKVYYWLCRNPETFSPGSYEYVKNYQKIYRALPNIGEKIDKAAFSIIYIIPHCLMFDFIYKELHSFFISISKVEWENYIAFTVLMISFLSLFIQHDRFNQDGIDFLIILAASALSFLFRLSVVENMIQSSWALDPKYAHIAARVLPMTVFWTLEFLTQNLFHSIFSKTCVRQQISHVYGKMHQIITWIRG